MGSLSLSQSMLLRMPILKSLSEAAFFLERIIEFGGDIREMEARKGLQDVLNIISNGTHIIQAIETLEAEIFRLNELSTYHAKQCRYTSAIALSSQQKFEEVRHKTRQLGLNASPSGADDSKDETSDENFEMSSELKRASTYMTVSLDAAKHAQLQLDTINGTIQENEKLLKERILSIEEVVKDGKSILAWVTRASMIGHAKKKDRADFHFHDQDTNSDTSETSQERKLRKMDSVYPLQEGYTLCMFSTRSPTRLFCAYICSMPCFEKTTMFFIFLSSVALAIDSPLMDPDSDLRYILQLSDLFFTGYFVFEMVVKVVTYGFWFMPKAYLKDGFNALDFFIVISGLLSLWEGGGVLFKSLRALRALRSLRPLRIIKRFDSLKIVVNALINVVPDVVNVLLLCLLFFIMFGVIFVQNLKGEFFVCQGDEFDNTIAGTDKETLLINPKLWSKLTETQQGWFSDNIEEGPTCEHWNVKDVPTSKIICKCLGAEWSEIISQNFDNINNALWTLYELSTTEGWLDVAIASVDARGIDMQPVRDYNVMWAFSFIAFMFTGSFFFMNLFVGVLYERFVQAQCDLEGGRNYLTKEQEEYIVAQRLSIRFKPVPKMRVPKNIIRRKAYNLVTHFFFEVAILGCIILNSIVMALSYFGENDVYGSILESFNFTFAAIFTLEACLKLLALGTQYFNDWWNCFDLSIVIGTMFGIVVTLFSAGGGGGFIVALRAFRLARILRIIQGAEALQEMINTLLFTLAGLVNVMGLLFLLFFVYTVMGVQLFSKIAYNGDLDVHANFRTFGSAILTLFRFATGENWNGFMYDVAQAGGDVPGGCVADPVYDINMCGFNNRPGCFPMNGCGNDAIFFYLYSFIMVAFFVSLNLFVGVILDAFQNANESGRMFRLSDMEAFQSAWSRYDQEACGFIDTLDLLHLIQHLPQPWGFGGAIKATQYQVRQRIAALGLPMYAPGSSVFYYDVFFSLTAAVILEKEKKIRKAEEAEAKKKQEIFDEIERRRTEAKERQHMLSKLTSAFQHGGSARGNSSFHQTLGTYDTQHHDEDDEDDDRFGYFGSGDNGVVFEEDRSSSDTDSSKSEILDDETVDPITEMIDGRAAASFNKMRKAVSILCKRHAMRDHEGNRPLTASDDYAARFIQKKFVIYLKNKHEKERKERIYAARAKHHHHHRKHKSSKRRS